MQTVPAGNVMDPLAGLVIWLALVVTALAGAAWLVRLMVRAVRALEKRSTVAEEVLLLSARVAQQDREIADLRTAVQRISAPRQMGAPEA